MWQTTVVKSASLEDPEFLDSIQIDLKPYRYGIRDLCFNQSVPLLDKEHQSNTFLTSYREKQMDGQQYSWFIAAQSQLASRHTVPSWRKLLLEVICVCHVSDENRILTENYTFSQCCGSDSGSDRIGIILPDQNRFPGSADENPDQYPFQLTFFQKISLCCP